MTRDRIEYMREAVLPFVKKKLLEIDYEGLGKSDAAEFEKDFNEILNMAVKTLEQELTAKNDLDCISRDSAIKALSYDIKHFEFKSGVSKYMDDISKLLNTIYEIQVNNIKALSPVTPQAPRWIPVSERLPKEDGEYLLFGKINEDEENYIFVGEYDSCGEQFGIWQEQFDRVTLGCLGSEFFEYSSVIAWQPLPKPYKAESEDEK